MKGNQKWTLQGCGIASFFFCLFCVALFVETLKANPIAVLVLFVLPICFIVWSLTLKDKN
jgi:succinate-acetate transporter protein